VTSSIHHRIISAPLHRRMLGGITPRVDEGSVIGFESVSKESVRKWIPLLSV